MIIKNVTTIGMDSSGNVYLELCVDPLECEDPTSCVYIDNVNDVHILNDSTVAIETPQVSTAHR